VWTARSRRDPNGCTRKIYTGTATLDRLLTESLDPVIRRALGTGAADRWFFLRYGDPEWHLRLRFHGRSARLLGEVLPALHEALAQGLSDGRLWKIQIDTYEREVERYGGPEGILLAEAAFHVDSEIALRIANMLGGEQGSEARWRLALYGIDRLLDDLGFDLDQKLRLVRYRKEDFAREFRIDKGGRIRLGTRYRRERAALQALFLAGDEACASERPGDHELAPALARAELGLA
jgi:thiopeptide-type bacteriocin biosynthesis protein